MSQQNLVQNQENQNDIEETQGELVFTTQEEDYFNYGNRLDYTIDDPSVRAQPSPDDLSGLVGEINDAHCPRDGHDVWEPRTMAYFKKNSDEAYNDLAETVQEMGNNFFEYVHKQIGVSTRKYVRYVIPTRDARETDGLVRLLQSTCGPKFRGMFGFSVDPGHVHIIHDCSYSDKSCRCVFRKQIESFRGVKPTNEKVESMWKLGRCDWYDVFTYFFLRKRGTRNLWIRGESWEKPSDTQLVRWEEKCRTWETLVRCKDNGNNHVGEGRTNKRNYREANFGSLETVHEAQAKRPFNKFADIRQKTKKLLRSYYTTPLSSIKDIPEFREDDTLTDPKNKDYIAASLEDFAKDLNDYNLEHFFELFYEYNEECGYKLYNKSAIFNSSMNYGTIEDSLEWVDELLKYQFGDDVDTISEFLTSLCNVLNKQLPKCNTIVVKSPPSGGKNFFFDMIFSILLNYGQLGQANKHNVFAFQEAPNKRVLLWNEPNYESSLTDTIKMMLAGDPYTVRVKHNMDQHVKKTPVIVLTNNHVDFMSDPAFRDRIKIFNWQSAPFLQHITQKPYPLAFFELLLKYNIDF
nr:MAG: nonstructural protein 1 [Emberiza rustica ambidensovirus]